jgi:hypothetical protein
MSIHFLASDSGIDQSLSWRTAEAGWTFDCSTFALACGMSTTSRLADKSTAYSNISTNIVRVWLLYVGSPV